VDKYQCGTGKEFALRKIFLRAIFTKSRVYGTRERVSVPLPEPLLYDQLTYR
jgi:hypothetical protein